ncbi:putative carboxylesterase 11 [Acorus calamus]|uniref:Carboxylesterase 11 n=1 Tax=Acorus calamus TaxID=4465 RepID=A0AAV9EXE9_ACOCL|nr:putative carboxylesterase 11 [Acorus calamus]
MHGFPVRDLIHHSYPDFTEYSVWGGDPQSRVSMHNGVGPCVGKQCNSSASSETWVSDEILHRFSHPDHHLPCSPAPPRRIFGGGAWIFAIDAQNNPSVPKDPSKTNQGRPFAVTSRPDEETLAAANPSFSDGVATKDIHIDPLTSLSLRIFLPDSSL